MGVALLGIALVLVVVSALLEAGDPAGALRSAVIPGTMGRAGLAGGALQLPAWSRERLAQMEAVAQRLQESVGGLREGPDDPA